MAELARLRISKVALKDGYYIPGATARSHVQEGAGTDVAYFKRTGETEWARITILEFVRLIR